MRSELLTVADTLQIEGRGIVLMPDFSVPSTGWTGCSHSVIVTTPNCDEYETIARFDLSHFNIRDPSVSVDRRWRVVLLFPGRSKEEVPIGSKILVSQHLKETLLPSEK